jgi:hypothetical protein
VTIARRLIAFALIAESLFAALYVANILPQLAIYDPLAIALVITRGALGALQFTAGWQLANRRPQGAALARWALVAAAVLTIFDVGLNLAPTSIYPWYRWHVTTAYGAYALAAVWLISGRGTANSQNP